MARVYNFSAGPAVLPEAVLKEAAAEMLDYGGTGMGVMEMSHRSKAYQNIIDTAENDLRELMGIPSNYKVLFLQGGASQQFAMVPMNLMKNKVADYIVTGVWAKKAAQEAARHQADMEAEARAEMRSQSTELFNEVRTYAASSSRPISFCPLCGAPVGSDSRFCGDCGTRLY